MLKGPAWIGENCQIRSGCYVRENVIVGTWRGDGELVRVQELHPLRRSAGAAFQLRGRFHPWAITLILARA